MAASDAELDVPTPTPPPLASPSMTTAPTRLDRARLVVGALAAVSVVVLLAGGTLYVARATRRPDAEPVRLSLYSISGKRSVSYSRVLEGLEQVRSAPSDWREALHSMALEEGGAYQSDIPTARRQKETATQSVVLLALGLGCALAALLAHRRRWAPLILWAAAFASVFIGVERMSSTSQSFATLMTERRSTVSLSGFGVTSYVLLIACLGLAGVPALVRGLGSVVGIHIVIERKRGGGSR